MARQKPDKYQLINSLEKTIDYLKNFNEVIDSNLIRKCLISDNIFSRKNIDREIEKYGVKDNLFLLKKVEAAKKVCQIINKNKDVLFVGITGSVAIGQPKENDDIDFIVITNANRLWRTRILIRWRLFREKIPHRKYNKKQGRDEFCFNLWIDSNNLLIPQAKQNLRNAIDLVNVIPLINKNNTYGCFVKTNECWAKNYVANQIDKFKKIKINKPVKTNIFDIVQNFLWYCPQKIYILLKRKKNIVTRNQAFFHE